MANKKSTNPKKKKKKNSSDDTMKFLLVLVIAGIAIALLIFMQKKEENGENPGETGTPSQTLAPSATEGAPTPTGAAQITNNPEPTKTQPPTATAVPTKAPTAAPQETPEPTEEPEPTPSADVLSAEDAQKLVKASVKGTYSVSLMNDHLWVGTSEYYQFYVLDENGQLLYPFLVVDKTVGSLHCYDAMTNTVSGFTAFPAEGGSTGVTQAPEEPKNISADEAYEVLCTYPKESLGLTKDVAHYDAEYGSELTLINRNNCYRINLFEISEGGKVSNYGEFYISVDGTKCYYIDSETNEFVLIQK